MIRCSLSNNHKHSMRSCERSQLLAFEGENESREIKRAEFLIQGATGYREAFIFGSPVQKSRSNSMAAGKNWMKETYPGGHLDPGDCAINSEVLKISVLSSHSHKLVKSAIYAKYISAKHNFFSLKDLLFVSNYLLNLTNILPDR